MDPSTLTTTMMLEDLPVVISRIMEDLMDHLDTLVTTLTQTERTVILLEETSVRQDRVPSVLAATILAEVTAPLVAVLAEAHVVALVVAPAEALADTDLAIKRKNPFSFFISSTRIYFIFESIFLSIAVPFDVKSIKSN